MFTLGTNKLVPWLLGVRAQDIIIVRIKSDVVLVNVGIEFVSAEHLRNLHELIIIIFSLKEGLLLENHA